MKKLKSLAAALCLILAILVFNVPDVNYGHGPDQDAGPAYEAVYDDEETDSSDEEENGE